MAKGKRPNSCVEFVLLQVVHPRIGFQVDKILGNDYQIILATRNEEKFIKATNELKKLDKKAKLSSIIFGYTFGVLGLLIVAINYPI